MGIIPLHLQDVSSSDGLLGSLLIPAMPKKVGLKGSPFNMRGARQKPKKNPRG
jgi:hypothetical protein